MAKKSSRKKSKKKSQVEYKAPPRIAQAWFAFLFIGLITLVVLMAWEFLTPVIFGLIIAGSFYPLNTFFRRKFKLSIKLTAALTCTIILLVVMMPVVYVIARLTQEATLASQQILSWLTEENIKATFFGENTISNFGREIFSFFNQTYSPESITSLAIDTAKTISTTIIGSISGLLSNTLYFFFQFLIMMILIYTVFVDGAELKNFMFRLSPLPHEDEKLIINRFNQMNFVTLVCNGLGGVIQGVLAGIAFWIAGVPSSLLWTVLMILLAFIPLVGISFVYVPVCIYLLISGQPWVALIVFIYCTIVALLTENWFKPIFMGNRVQIHSMAVFMSIMGGMSVFGMAGIFYGPLVIIIFLTFVELYHKRYSKDHDPQET